MMVNLYVIKVIPISSLPCRHDNKLAFFNTDSHPHCLSDLYQIRYVIIPQYVLKVHQISRNRAMYLHFCKRII